MTELRRAMTTYHPMTFTTTVRDGVLIIELRGAIDSALSLDPALESSLRSEAHNIVLVLTHIEYINSSGFSALIRFSDALGKSSKALYIVDLQSKVHIVFHSLGAHSVLNVLPKLDDALEQISKIASVKKE
jgi:anti-anti-sigma factor